MSLPSVAIVTGAQQGIGAATVRALARNKMNCVVNYLDDEIAARKLVRDAMAMGARATAVAADVSTPEGVARLIAAAADLGTLWALVNNAAIFPRRPLLELTDQDWDALMSVNLRGPFLCLRECARVMVGNGEGGSIVNISSLAAVQPSARGTHYAAAKAGIVGLTRAAASELGVHKIRVNAVAPGLTDTAQPRYGLSEDEIAEVAAAIPIGHLAKPDDIADVIAFLCSDASRHITGQVLHVNGGQYYG